MATMLAALAACAATPAVRHAAAGPLAGNSAAVGTAVNAAATGGSGDAPAAAARDPAEDWRALLPALLDTALQDLHLELHELVYFRDDGSGAADATADPAAAPATSAESEDCYAVGGPAPRFLGRVTERYALCFRHDRLDRVQATVRFDADDDAAVLFQRYCAAWGAAADAAARCAGGDDTRRFEARLEAPDGESATLLTIVVYKPRDLRSE